MDEHVCLAETHCFSQDSRDILLDVRQGRFFGLTPVERDALAAASVAAREGAPLETWRAGLRQTHDEAEIDRALARLRERGILLSQPAPSAAGRAECGGMAAVRGGVHAPHLRLLSPARAAGC